MNSNIIVKNIANGLYLVQGKGFIANKAGATRFDSAEASDKLVSASDVGIVANLEEVTVSYSVVYIRRKDIKADGVGLAKKMPDSSLNEIDPSKRRFATEDEAWQHGSRARERKANKNDAPGSAGHRGFYVVETTDPVNSAINWKTGLTNSL